MATSTTTTFSAVQAAFVTAAAAAVPAGVTVHRLWPGPSATEQMVFCTEVDWTDTEDIAIKSGRRWVDERYDINFEIWSLKSGEPDGGATAINEAKAIFDACSEVVRQDGSAVMAVDGVSWIVCRLIRAEALVIGNGYGFVMTCALTVQARLT